MRSLRGPCRRRGGFFGLDDGRWRREHDGRLGFEVETLFNGREKGGRRRSGEGGGGSGDGIEGGLSLLHKTLQALNLPLRRIMPLLRVFPQPVMRRK